MKYLIFALFLLIPFSFIFSQRGLKPISIKVNQSDVQLYEQSHALIIGVSNYTSGWPVLPGVKKDINAVQEVLEQNGFNVIVKENLTKEQMDQAFVEFIGKYGQNQNNRLLFYFAGHGHTVKTSFGELIGYIVPTDAPNPNLDQTGFMSKSMPMSRIEEYAKLTQSKHALFLFDACFSGSLFALTRAVPEIINYNTSKPVRQFITSGSEDETVPDESIFCQQFIMALKTDFADSNKDGYLTGTELGKFLQDNVVNYSHNSQHPQYGKIRNPFLDKGDFVFILPGQNEMIPTEDLTSESMNENNISPTIGNVTKLVRHGSLELDTEIGGSLYIDGKFVGSVEPKTKVPIHNVTPGYHKLEIKVSNQKWEQTLLVTENKTTYVIVKNDLHYGRIELESGIAGNLFIDGKDMGMIKEKTIIPIDNVISGSRKLEIKGNRNWEKYVTVYKDQTTFIKTNDSDNQNLHGQLLDSRDNKYYKTIKIGNQVWMAENLVYKTEGGCWSYDNDNKNSAQFGYLYDWVNANKVCPAGWKLPTKEDFEILLNNVGGNGNPAYTSLLPTGNSGFSALLAGWRRSRGYFHTIGSSASFWSSTETQDNNALHLLIYDYSENADIGNSDKTFGFSVRCILDN